MQRPQPEQACRDHEQSKLSRVGPALYLFFFLFFLISVAGVLFQLLFLIATLHDSLILLQNCDFIRDCLEQTGFTLTTDKGLNQKAGISIRRHKK